MQFREYQIYVMYNNVKNWCQLICINFASRMFKKFLNVNCTIICFHEEVRIFDLRNICCEEFYEFYISVFIYLDMHFIFSFTTKISKKSCTKHIVCLKCLLSKYSNNLVMFKYNNILNSLKYFQLPQSIILSILGDMR